MYRTFAIGTLIAAPLIVMAIQNFVPQTPPGEQLGAAEQIAAPPTPGTPPPVVPVAPTAAPAYSAPDNAGKPVSGAGEPMLTTSGTDSVTALMPANPADAPPGSPNAEI